MTTDAYDWDWEDGEPTCPRCGEPCPHCTHDAPKDED